MLDCPRADIQPVTGWMSWVLAPNRRHPGKTINELPATTKKVSVSGDLSTWPALTLLPAVVESRLVPVRRYHTSALVLRLTLEAGMAGRSSYIGLAHWSAPAPVDSR